MDSEIALKGVLRRPAPAEEMSGFKRDYPDGMLHCWCGAAVWEFLDAFRQL
jgi:hypothetical protein